MKIHLSATLLHFTTLISVYKIAAATTGWEFMSTKQIVDSDWSIAEFYMLGRPYAVSDSVLDFPRFCGSNQDG